MGRFLFNGRFRKSRLMGSAGSCIGISSDSFFILPVFCGIDNIIAFCHSILSRLL
jgi:hypothetical protein